MQGSCGISRPLGDPKQLRAYLAKGSASPAGAAAGSRISMHSEVPQNATGTLLLVTAQARRRS